VARVAELHEARRGDIEARFNAVALLVDAGRKAVEAGDLLALGHIMSENQRHLVALEVSCPEIDQMCGLATGAGAAGAKLTGGGGGGCVIAVGPGREEAILQAWESAGFKSFVAQLGGTGVSPEFMSGRKPGGAA
jgi:mevalonate kinase